MMTPLPGLWGRAWPGWPLGSAVSGFSRGLDALWLMFGRSSVHTLAEACVSLGSEASRVLLQWKKRVINKNVTSNFKAK